MNKREAGKPASLFHFTFKRTGTLVGADRKRDTMSVGYDYPFSKRTDLYTIAMSDKISNASRAASFGAGVRHKF